MPVDTSHPRGDPLLRARPHLVPERGEVRDRFCAHRRHRAGVAAVASRLDTITKLSM